MHNANVDAPNKDKASIQAVQDAHRMALGNMDWMQSRMLSGRVPAFDIGIVTLALPSPNVFRVRTNKGGIVEALALCQGSNRINGVRGSASYLPGTFVLIAALPLSETDPEAHPYLIMGEVCGMGHGADDRYVFDTYGSASMRSGADFDLSVERRKVVGLSSDRTLARDFGWGKPLDAMPGRHTLTNAFDGGFVVDDFMVMAKTSEMAKIQLFQYDDTVRVVADHFEHYGAMYDKRIARVGYGASQVESHYMTLREALGGLEGKALSINSKCANSDPEGELRRASDKQIPFPSYVKITGNAADGVFEYIAAPPKGSVYKSDDMAQLPMGLLSEEKTFDGRMSVKCASGLSISKTMRVSAPKMMATLEGDPPDPSYTRQSWDQVKKLKSGVGAAAGRAFLTEYERFNDDNGRPEMGGCVDRWYDVTSSYIYDNFKAVTGTEFMYEASLDALDPLKPHYDEPARKVDVKVFQKGGVRVDATTIYDNDAGVNILADGSVVIYGGCGEEIRMYRGNIYLTCPGDIIQQPGRDSINFAPRHNVVKAGKGALELTSNGTATLASKGDVQIIAASSGERGTLIIENKSPQFMDTATFEKDGPLSRGESSGGGVVIKSAGSLYLDAEDTTIGSSEKFDDAIVNIEADTIINRCATNTTYLEGAADCSFGVLSRNGSGFGLYGNKVQLMCPQLIMGVNNINILRSSPISIEGVSGHTQELDNLTYQADKPNIWIDGNITVSQQVKAGGLAAPGGASDIKLEDFNKSIKSLPRDIGRSDDNNKGVLDILQSVAYPLIFAKSLAGSLGGDPKLLDMISARFPTSKAYQAEAFYLPMVGWHGILKDGDAGLWAEPEVPAGGPGYELDKTMSFPGADAWKKDGSVRYFDKTKDDSEALATGKLSEIYKTNIK